VTRPRLYRVSAVVLRQRELAEADRIVLLLSRERGKLSAVAKGVRRPRSKLAGGLQLFSHVRLLVAVGRNLDLITQCQPLESFLPLREDLDRFALASHVIELADGFTEEGARLPRLFDLLLGSLRALCGSAAPDLVARGFELKLMNLLGYGPQLSGCISCGKEALSLRPTFSISLGGLVCGRCRPAAGGAVSLGPRAVEAMGELGRLPVGQAGSLSLSPQVRGELEGALRSYLEYRLERGLKSVAVLRALRPGGALR